MNHEDLNAAEQLVGARKTILIVLFIPSVARDGTTPTDQERWVEEALMTFGRLFGGATAFPRARGVWRDDERAGQLVFDEVVVMHSYVKEALLAKGAGAPDPFAELGAFCRRLGRDTNQGEVGVVIDNQYIAFEPPFSEAENEQEQKP